MISQLPLLMISAIIVVNKIALMFLLIFVQLLFFAYKTFNCGIRVSFRPIFNET